MYIPQAFAETRAERLHALIREYPLAALVAHGAAGLQAQHLPLLLDPEPAPFGTLRGHVARANPFWRELDPDGEVLALFRGPQAYVSPSWYPSKRAGGRAVPTWNYAAVHARGPLRLERSAPWLRAHLERLVAAHEAGFAEPWRISDAPADFIEGLLGGIVGLELPIRELSGQWKMSQNRAEADRAGVAEGLRALPGDEPHAVAALVAGVRAGPQPSSR
jgi:transcriptional regulator